MPPKGRDGKGVFLPDVDVAERRNASAKMRSEGVTLQAIADKHWNGDKRTANREIKRFWADQPKETVEEIRSTILAKLSGLEQDARRVMARRHYVVDKGVIVKNHTPTCDLEHVGVYGRRACSCPRLVDDAPIYAGIDRVNKLVETTLKLVPGLAAPKAVDVRMSDDDLLAEIERLRAEVPDPDASPAGDVGGVAEPEGPQG